MTRNEQASPSATYDDDFFTWTQEQAAALRLTRDAVGKSVDIEHLAEEIEDLGKRDLREVGSFLARLIGHLLKIDACQDSRDRPHWLSEAGHLHSSAVDAFTPGMRQLLSLEKIWRRGCKDATLCLEEMNVAFTPPVTCLFTLDQLLAEDFDLRAALRTLAEERTARDTPRP